MDVTVADSDCGILVMVVVVVVTAGEAVMRGRESARMKRMMAENILMVFG